jgi:predicted carbohydrate-binding protein with CBM5 and CBM33 domain
MALHWFTSPVFVATDEGRDRYAVSNIERAAEFLLSWRGCGQGESWRAAVQACMAAIKNQISVEEARSAFEAAAVECGQLPLCPRRARIFDDRSDRGVASPLRS